jgi:secreted trypsin-like serine protease
MISGKFQLFMIIFFLSSKFATSHRCGTQKYFAQFSIGGEEAAEGQFPWKVAIFFKYDEVSFRYWCGGSLIGKQHVLTGI